MEDRHPSARHLALLLPLLSFAVLGCEAIGDPVFGPHLTTSADDQGVTTDSDDDEDYDTDVDADGALGWKQGCGGARGPKLRDVSQNSIGCCLMPPTPASGSLANQLGCEDGTYCRSFRDGPPDPTAMCAPLPPLGNDQVLSTGTVFNLGSILEPPYAPTTVPGVKVSMLGGVAAAINPFQQGIVTKMTDASGRFNATIAASGQAVAIVAVQTKEGYFPSITGVISNKNGYEKVAANHDYYIVPRTLVEELNLALSELNGIGKIGASGGVIAIIRDPSRGPVAGLRLRSHNASSKASIAYLKNDGTFVADGEGVGTFASGIAVVTGVAVTGERFFVEAKDGHNVYPWSNSAGAVPDALFTMIMNVDCGDHC